MYLNITSLYEIGLYVAMGAAISIMFYHKTK